MEGRQKQKLPVERPPLGDRLRYYVDLFMSWSPWARFVGLFVVSLLLVACSAWLAKVVSPGDSELHGDFLEAMWWAMMRVADAGSMADDKGTLVRLVAVSATLSGIMVVAVLIGLVSTAVHGKIEDLRKGKSPIIDSDHTLILGFNDKIYPILRELREANGNRKNACIVVLSPADKLETEEAIKERMGDMRNTRLVVRQGSAFSPHDLKKVGAGRARSIIILSDDGSGDGSESDMAAIKTLLALRRVPGALVSNHAVVELRDVHRVPVIERLGNGGVEAVAMRDTLARLMVQTARQNGLAGVYRDLLGFEGSELYFKNFPELAGMTFGEVRAVLAGAIPIGFRRKRELGAAELRINPPSGTNIEAKDELLVLAEDDDSFSVEADGARAFKPARGVSGFFKGRSAEKILICGSRSDLERLLRDFDQYVAPGSKIYVMAGPKAAAPLPVTDAYKNLKLEAVAGDPTDPADLKAVMKLEVDAVLHLANDTIDPGEADAVTVISLLIMRDLYAMPGVAKKPRMISEVIDPRTKDLVSDDDSTDFVVSSEITSMLMAQVSEQRELNRVYTDLFDPDGSEVYLKSVERYVEPNAQVTWGSVQASAAAAGECAIGCFRTGAKPLLNPDKNTMVSFKNGDKLIVLAEDDAESGISVHAA